MSVAKVTEIIASSTTSFDDAVAEGVKRADRTLKGIKSAWVKEQQVVVDGGKITEYRVTLSNRDGAAYMVNGRRPLLEQLRDQGVDLPYGCEYGGCITCAAKLVEGHVDQRRQVALNNRQIENGYVILCVARAVTDITLEIGVESHDKLYRNPFLDPLKPHELKADIATPEDV